MILYVSDDPIVLHGNCYYDITPPAFAGVGRKIMIGFKTFSWRGEPILNIEEWALKNKNKMVDIVWLVKQINPYAKNPRHMITWIEEKETMPESFFNTLRFEDDRRIKNKKLRMPKIAKTP